MNMHVQIVHDKILSVVTDTPARVVESIPRSKIVGDKVLVNFGLAECHILKNLGALNVPSPIHTQYQWPGKYTPFVHQRVTSSFLTMHRRAYCFNAMGTGKSNAAIWAADYLMKQGVVKRVLIVCPLSVMDTAWKGDLFKTAMHRQVAIAHGSRAKRIDIVKNTNNEFVLINFDGVITIERTISEAKFDLIIIDEANAYKNPSTERWKCMNRVVTANTWLWLLTGTPAAQSPLDAYGLAKLLRPESVPRTLNAFKSMVQIQVFGYTFINKPDVQDIIFNLLQPAIRYSKEECLDLPELTYQTRDIPMSTQQLAYYKEFKKELLVQWGAADVSAANAAVALNKMLQIASGSVYTDTKDTMVFDTSARTEELKSILKETPHKTLVFGMFRHTLQMLAKVITDEGYSVGVIHGGVSAKDRANMIRAFQDSPDPQVLLIQPQSAAHGITLHAADTIVWWGVPLSLETYLQANARIHRAGQVNKCTVVHLIGSPVERKVLTVLEAKGTDQVKLLSMYKSVLE